MEDNIELKVGEQFYSISRGRITGIVTIERVTKTQAITSNNKFKRYQNRKDRFISIGSGSFNTTYYYRRTLQLDNQYSKQKLVNKLSNIDWDKYNLEKLRDINSFL